ncbi:hypothetical protein BG004_002223 [Podila humilis]|nr:hypothetical protein BG004_002223 [Podila humilis]
MFDIPEVGYKVFKNLEMNDLIQCGLVCKTWYLSIVPLMWQRIPADLSRTSWNLFYEQIFQDYLQSKIVEQREQNQLNSTETPTVTEIWQRPDYIPALSRYGPNVREVKLCQLWLGLRDTKIDMEKLQMEGISDASALQVFQHFLKRCPNIQCGFEIAIPSHDRAIRYDDPYNFAIAVIPYLRQASISDEHGYKTLITIPALKRILSAASADLLENLELILSIDDPAEQDAINASPAVLSASPEPHPVITARPKRLRLDIAAKHGKYGSKTFNWSWLWPICCQVKELELFQIVFDILEPLAVVIRDSMPCLDTLKMCMYEDSVNHVNHYDKLYGQILETCPRPLRNLTLYSNSILGSHVRMGIRKYAATLESLHIDYTGGIAGLVDVLRVCSSLKDLKIAGFWRLKVAMDATRFADYDPVSEELNTWLCQHTLETLHVVCDGIPKWSPQEDPSIRFQSKVIQQKLCERLGQFTNLRLLRLCYQSDVPYNYNRFPPMMLGTGLEKLSGLKRLKKAHFHERLSKGASEIEWISKHWENISVIDDEDWSAPARRLL